MDKKYVLPAVKMVSPYGSKLEGKRVICTGTNGFLGKWFVRTISELNRAVLKQPCRLIAIDLEKPSKDEQEEIGGGDAITYVGHNLAERFKGLTDGKIDYVVHMAGIASPFHYKRLPLQTIDIAVEGSRGMLEIAREHDAKYLFCSSSEVYQTADVNPTPETFVGAIPSNTSRSCYDVSKLMGETLAHVYADQYNTDTSIIRIFNSMGPGLRENDHRILPRIASSIVRKQRIKVYKNKTQPSRTYCPAANTTSGLFLALLNGKSQQIYNIGLDGPELTVVELIERIERVINKKIDWVLEDAPDVYVDEPLRRCPDISKARKELGYDPMISLDEGLKAFFEWALCEYPKFADPTPSVVSK
jgi:UDP-glucuronate decarboxylase